MYRTRLSREHRDRVHERVAVHVRRRRRGAPRVRLRGVVSLRALRERAEDEAQAGDVGDGRARAAGRDHRGARPRGPRASVRLGAPSRSRDSRSRGFLRGEQDALRAEALEVVRVLFVHHRGRVVVVVAVAAVVVVVVAVFFPAADATVVVRVVVHRVLALDEDAREPSERAPGSRGSSLHLPNLPPRVLHLLRLPEDHVLRLSQKFFRNLHDVLVAKFAKLRGRPALAPERLRLELLERLVRGRELFSERRRDRGGLAVIRPGDARRASAMKSKSSRAVHLEALFEDALVQRGLDVPRVLELVRVVFQERSRLEELALERGLARRRRKPSRGRRRRRRRRRRELMMTTREIRAPRETPSPFEPSPRPSTATRRPSASSSSRRSRAPSASARRRARSRFPVPVPVPVAPPPVFETTPRTPPARPRARPRLSSAATRA